MDNYKMSFKEMISTLDKISESLIMESLHDPSIKEMREKIKAVSSSLERWRRDTEVIY